jgi:REP element-mobilizing transposase RayT
MARPLRLDLPEREYHITQHGIDDLPIFRDDDDRSLFHRLLGIELRRSGWLCLAYCLMTTHYHLVLRQAEARLSNGLQHLNGRYAQLFNKRHRRRGHLFEARFGGRLIDDEAHRCEVLRYVHLNPSRAMPDVAPEDWPWSDYGSTIGLRPPDPLVDPAVALEPFGAELAVARRNYRAFVAEADVRVRRGAIVLTGPR